MFVGRALHGRASRVCLSYFFLKKVFVSFADLATKKLYYKKQTKDGGSNIVFFTSQLELGEDEKKPTTDYTQKMFAEFYLTN